MTGRGGGVIFFAAQPIFEDNTDFRYIREAEEEGGEGRMLVRSVEQLATLPAETLLRAHGFTLGAGDGGDAAGDWFAHEGQLEGRVPLRCLPLRTAVDSATWRRYVRRVQTGLPAVEASSFGGLREELEELLDGVKDPETLDDSDLEMLDVHESQTEEDTGTLEMVELRQTYVLLSLDAIFEAGSSYTLQLNDVIQDCIVMDSIDTNIGSILLLTHANGVLYSLLLDKGSAIVLQYWDLGNKGAWNLVSHDPSNQFVAYQKENGICKFFKFTNSLHFELVNNLTLHKTTLIDCTFMMNSSSSHFIIFIPTIRFQRLVYFCVEWDIFTQEKKEVHQLTHLGSEVPIGCCSLGHNKCLVYSASNCTLISANQVMSGETTFSKFPYRPLRGIRTSFNAPSLLDKLQKFNPKMFKPYTQCVVLSMSTGNICLCLLDDKDSTDFFTLTRFKGLKHISPAIQQPIENDSYNIVVISFGKTLQLTIDLAAVQPITPSTIIHSLTGIKFKQTIDSSSEENTGIMPIVPIKKLSRNDVELILTSPVAITQTNPLRMVRKAHTLCKLSTLKVFNKLLLVNCSQLSDELRHHLFEEVTDGELLIATNSTSISAAFILDLTTFDAQLIDLDDLLFDNRNTTLAVWFTNNLLVQVTDKVIFMGDLDSSEENSSSTLRVFSPGWSFDNVSHLDDKVIVWNSSQGEVWYTADIKSCSKGTNFIQSNLLHQLHLNNEDLLDIKIIPGGPTESAFVLIFTVSSILLLAWNDFSQCTGSYSFIWPNVCAYSSEVVGHTLCFINDNYIFTTIDLNTNQLNATAFDVKGKDVQIRHISEDTCLVFSSFFIVIIELDSNGKIEKQYDLKLPYQSKTNPMLDVKVHNNTQILMLYADGMHVLELSYFTSSMNSHLLRSTRTTHKGFLFINKINRMLVVNLDTQEWDCVKLGDGKTLSLDPSVIKSTGPQKITNVLEVPDNIFKDVCLIIVFDTKIKLVHIRAERSRLTVEEIDSHDFGRNISDKVLIWGYNELLVLAYGNGAINTKGEKMDTFYRIKIEDHKKLILLDQLNFNGGSIITEFENCNNDIIMTTNKWDKLFVFKDYEKLVKVSKPRVIQLNKPSGTYVCKILRLSHDKFVVATKCEARSDHLTELLFYRSSDIVLKDAIIQRSYLGEDRLIFDIDESDNYVEVSIDHPEDMPSTQRVLFNAAEALDSELANYLDQEWRHTDNQVETQDGTIYEYGFGDSDEELINRDDNIDGSRLSASDIDNEHFPTKLTITKKRSPYQIIKLEKALKNITYDPVEQALYVLAVDQTVFKFIATSETQDAFSHNRIRSTHQGLSQFREMGKITNAGLWQYTV